MRKKACGICSIRDSAKNPEKGASVPAAFIIKYRERHLMSEVG